MCRVAKNTRWPGFGSCDAVLIHMGPVYTSWLIGNTDGASAVCDGDGKRQRFAAVLGMCRRCCPVKSGFPTTSRACANLAR